jgi:glycosyltransferase involved in cell wall biosynthesis
LKEIRAIQIIDSLHIGGAETLAVNISNGLKERIPFSSLCVTRNEGDLKSVVDSDIEYIFLDRKKTIDIKAIKKLLKFVSKHKITIIHAHSTSLYIAVLIKLCRPRLKLVWHNHYGLNVNNKSISLRLCSYFISLAINVSKELDTWVKKELHVKKTVFLPNFAEFNSEETTTTLKGGEGKRLVHVGGFRHEKDHLNLLKAFLLIKKGHPDWTLHLIGKDYKDGYSSNIHSFISEQNLTNAVFIYGLKTDIKNILSQSSIGVLSSSSEGLPLSLIEFGLARIPVVSTNVGQCLDIIETKNLVVPSKDPKAFAEAIMLLIKDEEFYAKEAEKLNMTIKNRFSKNQFMNELVDLYASFYLD